MSATLAAVLVSARAQDAGNDPALPSLPAAADLLTPLAAPTSQAIPLLPRTWQHGEEAAQAKTMPAWTFTPSISANEMFNDNILQSQTDRRYDFVTSITPSLEIRGTTPRANVSLTYEPTLNLYARTPSQDWVGQQFFGAGTVTLIEDALYINARALGALVPTDGGFSGFAFAQPLGVPQVPAAGPLSLSRENLTQTYSGSVTPYVVHRFGDAGTGKLGLTLSETVTNGGLGVAPAPGLLPAGGQNATTGEITAQFQSGERFGRVRDFILLDASRTDGTGVLQNAHQATATNWLGYAVTRQIVPFAELGVEDIHYAGIPPVAITDAVWQLGVVLTPNADSRISLGYGHQQGADSFLADGVYAITQRSRVSISYNTGLATDLQVIQQQLGLADAGPAGAPINAITTAPLFVGNSLLGVQSTLYRNKTLTLTETTQLDRDTISLAFIYQAQTPVAFASPQANVPQVGITGSVAWTHELSPLATVTSELSYSRRRFDTSAAGNEEFVAATAAFSYRLTETLTGVISYAFYDRRSTIPGRTMYENIALIGVTKRF